MPPTMTPAKKLGLDHRRSEEIGGVRTHRDDHALCVSREIHPVYQPKIIPTKSCAHVAILSRAPTLSGIPRVHRLT
jgi:hypothetical protein